MTIAVTAVPPVSSLARSLTEPRGFGDQTLIAPRPDSTRLLGGIPAPEALPVPDIARASAELWSNRAAATAALQYSSATGFEGLRSWIARREGVDPARIVITNGGMHGLSLAVLTVIERGSTVAVDDPIFPLFLRVLELSTSSILPVRVDGDGLDVDALAVRLAAGERISAVYTVPDFHNPSQGTLTADRRRALVELADRYGFYLLIDNPYRELRFAGVEQGLAPFHESDRAIVVNTFTKTLGPGWRVGWLVLPEHLVAPVLRLRNRLDAHTSTVAQTLIERLVLTDPAWFDGVLGRASALYAERAQVLVDELDTALPGAFTTVRPEGGLFLWPRLADDTIDAAALAGRAADHGVLYQQGEFFASGADARESSRHLRLAYGDRTPEARRSFGRRSDGWPRRSEPIEAAADPPSLYPSMVADWTEYDYDLGDFHRAITTGSAEAAAWFDRGLIWSYGFNHEEAAVCFERAAAADSACAMAYWGLAYALGPNYNKPWEFFDEADLRTTVSQTHEAVQHALALAGAASPVERALIGALGHRYPAHEVGDGPADTSVWNADYADAMGGVYREFDDDLDVATLYADALMNLTPWQLWDLRTGEPAPGSRADEAQQVLERALSDPAGLRHPGLLHMYIHLVEMSAAPEQGLVIAGRLGGLVPDAGHLHHMPSHLYVLCGDYRGTVAANTRAIEADAKFRDRSGPMNFYTLYRSHNFHFRIYGAMLAGQSRVALETAQQLEDSIPEELLRVPSPPMADWLEGFLAMRVHVLIRFGRWSDILELQFPRDQELYCVTTAMTHYARGVALAATGRVPDAEGERELFRAAAARVSATRMLFNNTCQDILTVGSAMLDGEIEYRKGNVEQAFTELRRAIALDDALPYDEPWGWMQPTRHAYGALLLEQGHVRETRQVYAADLGFDDTLPRALQHPGNVWSLHGFHECLTTLGEHAEAAIIAHQLRIATAVADVPIQASCFCRLTAIDTHTHTHTGPGECCSTADTSDIG
ncbi:MAG TPA: PLP-dependent aminotransferase family protein [Nakamurella sp.]